MSKNAPAKNRRTKGDGSLYYNEQRQRWMAQIDLGFDENGKRIRKCVSAGTKSEALSKIRVVLSGKAPEPEQPKTPNRHDLYEYTKEYLNEFKMNTVSSRTFEWYRNIS